MSFLAELKRRKVVKVAVAYAATMWLLVQAASIVFPAFEFPSWVLQTVLVVAVLGFFVTVMLAWIYELAPEGLRRTEDSPVARSAKLTGRKLDFALIGLLSLALMVVVLDRYMLEERPDTLDAFLSEGTARLVSNFPGSHSQPTLSPDGTMIAFTSDASGSRQIWVKNLAQGDPVQITNGAADALSPSWSPRNDQILFERRSSSGFVAIFSVGPLGSPEPRLVIEPGVAPSFAWDGRSFAYAEGNEILIADADGSNRRMVAGLPQGGFAPRVPSLSPDGTLIAFVHADEGPAGNIWVIPRTGGEARRLTSHGGIDGGFADAPSWTPDGRFILYRVGIIGAQHLWRVAVESGEAERLTTGTGGYGHPVMSRDGETLLYTNTRSVWRLMRTDLNSQREIPIYTSRNPIALPIVSRDGGSVVFFSLLTSGQHIFTIGVDSQNLRQWTFDEPGSNTLPTWSANGESIYFYKSRSLHRLSLSGGPSIEVIADFHWSSRNWLAVHNDKIAFHEFGLEPGRARTVIKDLSSGSETALPEVEELQWSRDGTALLGSRPDGVIVICPATGGNCEPLIGASGPIRGGRPHWSMDETRIFFRRPSARAFFRELWSVDRDGGDETKYLEFGPLEEGDLYGIGQNDEFVWNQYDRRSDEIWLARRTR